MANPLIRAAAWGLARLARYQPVQNGLRQLARLDAATRERMGAAGRQFVLDNHIYPVLARRFLDACRTA